MNTKPANIYPDMRVLEKEMIDRLYLQFNAAITDIDSMDDYLFEKIEREYRYDGPQNPGLRIYTNFERPCFFGLFSGKKKEVMATITMQKSADISNKFKLRCVCLCEDLEDFLIKFIEDFSQSSAMLDNPDFIKEGYI